MSSESIQSKDGTVIAYRRSGAGAPLVLTHGTLGSHGGWSPVLPMLEPHFTVYAMDRRGRGESGDGTDYTLVREVEDTAALVDSIASASGGEVNLLGHSFGGLCVLEAVLLTANVRRLIVYEPSVLPVPGVWPYPAGIVERFQGMLDAGDREAVVLSLFEDLVGMPTEDLEYIKASPRFPAWVAAAHTVPREQRAEEEYRFTPERFQHLTLPVLLMLGGDSPDFFRATIEMWHTALPNSRIVILPGQQHLAQSTAPDLFAREVLNFLAEPD
jgi:pimeloyl-ACP methyl ester carboxylesterase